MTLTLITTNQFKKDYKRAKKRGLDMQKLHSILDSLCAQHPLSSSQHDHVLTGNYKGFRECHIEPNWLLVYAIDNEKLMLTAVRTGTHSDLFDE